MIGNCRFHVLSVLSTDAFYVKAPGHLPDDMVGCFIYNGKRSEICEGLRYNVPQSVSRSVTNLISRSYLSRTHLLGLRMMFSFVISPAFFNIEETGEYSKNRQAARHSKVEPG